MPDLKISIEGEDTQVMGILHILGAHAGVALSQSPSTVATASQPDFPVPDDPPNAVGTPAWLNGRAAAERVVEEWRDGWDLPPDAEARRAKSLELEKIVFLEF